MGDFKLQPDDFQKVTLPRALVAAATALFHRWRERYSGCLEIHFLNGEVQEVAWKVREKTPKATHEG